MILVVLNILVALLTGFGAVQEIIVRGIINGEVQPFIIGVMGVAISVLFIISGMAMWRRWATAQTWSIVAAISSIAFHIFAALPPHRYVGFAALIVGAGYGLVLLLVTLITKGKKAQPAIG